MTEAAAPEFPKVLVRVRRGAGGLEVDLREAADADAVTAAEAEGFIAVEVPATPFPPYPKWVYHADGRRQIVQNEDELTKLGDGFEDAPVEPEPPPVDPPPAP